MIPNSQIINLNSLFWPKSFLITFYLKLFPREKSIENSKNRSKMEVKNIFVAKRCEAHIRIDIPPQNSSITQIYQQNLILLYRYQEIE